MFEEARLPIFDPSLFEEKEKTDDEKKEIVIMIDISPKNDDAIDL